MNAHRDVAVCVYTRANQQHDSNRELDDLDGLSAKAGGRGYSCADRVADKDIRVAVVHDLNSRFSKDFCVLVCYHCRKHACEIPRYSAEFAESGAACRRAKSANGTSGRSFQEAEGAPAPVDAVLLDFLGGRIDYFDLDHDLQWLNVNLGD